METSNAFNKMALICSKKESCKFEIYKKLEKWKNSHEQKNKIIEQLVDENYINETRYTEAFVKDKFLFNKWGKQKIKFQLKQKRIAENDIENALSHISENNYWDTILQLLESKNKNLKANSDYERKGKLMRFMAQRGFGLDEVNQQLEVLLSNN